MKSELVLPISFSVLFAACGKPSTSVTQPPDATWLLSSAATFEAVDPVILWNRALLQIVRTPGAQPATVHPTHSFAILRMPFVTKAGRER